MSAMAGDHSPGVVSANASWSGRGRPGTRFDLASMTDLGFRLGSAVGTRCRGGGNLRPGPRQILSHGSRAAGLTDRASEGTQPHKQAGMEAARSLAHGDTLGRMACTWIFNSLINDTFTADLEGLGRLATGRSCCVMVKISVVPVSRW